MLAKQWGAAMIVVVVSAQRGAVNLNAFDELYGPDAQRERAADPYAAAFDDVDRPEVPSLDVLMGATQAETQMRLGGYLNEMYGLQIDVDAAGAEQGGHFDTPLVEHYQTRTAHNLANAMSHDLHWNDDHYDQLQHHDHAEIEHDLWQNDGSEVHEFHESLQDFFPNGSAYFPEPINLMQEMRQEDENVWFPMTEGEDWLMPRARRVEQVTYQGEPEERVHYHREAVREVVPVNLAEDEVFVGHGDHLHGSRGSIVGRDGEEHHEPSHTGDEVFVQHDDHHAHGSAGSIEPTPCNLHGHRGISECSMDLGLHWTDISTYEHSHDIGLEWVDISEPVHSHDIGIEWVDISEPVHSHDIGIEWVDISEPELNADIGLEWVEMHEAKLDGEIGLEWHDLEFEEHHIAPGPCDCDDLGDSFLLQEGHFDKPLVEHYQQRTAHCLCQQEEGHFDKPLVEHYQQRTAHNLANAMSHDLHWDDDHYDQLQHHDHAEIQHDLWQNDGSEVHEFHESLQDFFPNGSPYFPEPINLMQEMRQEDENVWFPMTEGEDWLMPRARRVEQVTYQGEPEERVHYHREAVREVVPVNLANAMSHDLHWDDDHYDQLQHHDHAEIQHDLWQNDGSEVHEFHESLQDFFPNGSPYFPEPINLMQEMRQEDENVWFPMTEGEDWLMPRARRVEQVTYQGEPEERVHYHREAVREVVPVNLANAMSHDLHWNDDHYDQLQHHDHAEIEHDLWQNDGSEVHEFHESLQDFFPNGSPYFPEPINLMQEMRQEDENVWFPMTEGEDWLMPRARRVEQVTYQGEPEERVHYHREAVREVVPVNLANAMSHDLHWDDDHYDQLQHHDHAEIEHDLWQNDGSEVHEFHESLQDFFPNGSPYFPEPINLMQEMRQEDENVWFPMTEGEDWLMPRARRVEQVTYQGEPEERVHYHREAVREVVPVNLAQVTRYHVDRNTREVSEGHFDSPLVDHHQPRTAHNLANAMSHDLHWDDDHYDQLQHHDHAEIEHDLWQNDGSEVHEFHESLQDFFPNGSPYFPEPINLMQEMRQEDENVWFPMTEGEDWLMPRARRVEQVTYQGEPEERVHYHREAVREVVPVNLAEGTLVSHNGMTYDGHPAHRGSSRSSSFSTRTTTSSTSTDEEVLVVDGEVFVEHEGTHFHGSGGTITPTRPSGPRTPQTPTRPTPTTPTRPTRPTPTRPTRPTPTNPTRPTPTTPTRPTPTTPSGPSNPTTPSGPSNPTTPQTPTEPSNPTPTTPQTLSGGSAIGSDLACHIIATDFTLFELHNINKASGAYSQGDLSWNFCQYLSGKEQFAAQGNKDLTGSDYIPSKTDTVKDGDNIVGVSVTRTSENKCKDDIDYQFTTIVKCDASLTGSGNGSIQSVDTSDECHPVVTMTHADGCYEYTANSLVRWLSENPTVLGIVFLLVGPIIAMCGKRWFPYIAAGIGAISMISLVMLCAGLFGLLSSWVWGVVSVLVALTAGILFGMFLRRMVWTAVGITGAISGFLFGGFVYTLILQAFSWKSYWGYWGLAVAFSVLFTVLTCTYGQQMVMVATSFFGSYIFVAGLNYVFGGSVGLVTMIAKIQDGENVTFTASTYIYLVVFICMFAFSTVWQAYKEQEHEELAEHTKKNGQYGRA